jgi:hypothetical protein
MRHASFSTSIASSTPAVSQDKPTRKSLLALLLDALHHSRSLQTQRVLAQYRHLIARYEGADAKRAISCSIDKPERDCDAS